MSSLGSKPLKMSVILVAVAVLSLGVAPAPAQQSESGPPEIMRVVETNVKPGMRGRWREVQKTVMLPAIQQAGGAFRHVWRVRFSEAGTDFAVVRPIEPLEQPLNLTEEEGKRARKMFREATAGGRSYVIRFHPELSFGERGAPDTFINVSSVTVAPGKRAEFRKIFKEMALPAWKERGLTKLFTYETLYGGNEWLIITPLKSLGDLANGVPFYRGLSEDEIDQAYASYAGVITSIRRAVGEFLPELSFTSRVEPSGSE